jgi:Golgi SNAP receptor complex protein 2
MSATILYNQAMRQIAEISQSLELLSKTPMMDDGSSSLLAQVSAQLSHLGQSLGELEGFAKREVTAVKRDIVSSRALKVRSEWTRLQESFERQKAQRLAAKEREELLSGAHSQGLLHNRSHHPPSQPPEDSTVLLMDMFAREGQVLGSSGDQIEQYIAVSKNALQELYEQRGMLKVFSYICTL